MKSAKIAAVLLATVFILGMIQVSNPVKATPVTVTTYPSSGPLPDEVLFKVYTDASAAYLALKAGEIDLQDEAIYPSQIADAQAEEAAGRLILSPQPQNIWYYWGIHCEASRYPLNETGFRKALAYMVDKQSVVATGLLGYGYAIDTEVPAAFFGAWSNPGVKTYPYSLTNANKTLYQNGWYYTGDHSAIPFTGGVWKDKNGNDLRSIWLINRLDAGRKLTGELLDLAMTSLDIPHTRTEGDSTYVATYVMNDVHGPWDMFTGGWQIGGPDPTFLWDFFATGSSDDYNFPRWDNISFDYWADKLISDPTYSEVLTDAFKCQEYLADGLPYIPVFMRLGVTAGSTKWENWVEGLGSGLNNFWNRMQVHKVGTTYGGTLRAALTQDIKTFNPIVAEWVWDWEVLENIYDGLLARDPTTMQLMPWMASSYDINIVSDVNLGWQVMRIDYVLRDNITWHDGEQVTADDIKFTYEWLVNNITAPRFQMPFALINTTVTGTYTASAFINTTSYFGITYLPGIMLPKHVWDRPEWTTGDAATNFARVSVVQPERVGMVIGSGPYYFYQYQPGEFTRIKAWASYFRSPSAVSNARATITVVKPNSATIKVPGVLGANFSYEFAYPEEVLMYGYNPVTGVQAYQILTTNLNLGTYTFNATAQFLVGNESKSITYNYFVNVVAAPPEPAWWTTGAGTVAVGATVLAVFVAAGLGYSLLRARRIAK